MVGNTTENAFDYKTQTITLLERGLVQHQYQQVQ